MDNLDLFKLDSLDNRSIRKDYFTEHLEKKALKLDKSKSLVKWVIRLSLIANAYLI